MFNKAVSQDFQKRLCLLFCH